MQRGIVQFDVDGFNIVNRGNAEITSGNRNYIFARFNFSPHWNGLTKKVLFAQEGITTNEITLENDICEIPNVFMIDPGIINVSVYGGDRLVTDIATVKVKQGGYKEGIPPFPPEPTYEYVQSPGGSVSLIREKDGQFEFFANDEWNVVKGGGGVDGAKGERGEQGIQGERGEKGEPGSGAGGGDETILFQPLGLVNAKLPFPVPRDRFSFLDLVDAAATPELYTKIEAALRSGKVKQVAIAISQDMAIAVTETITLLPSWYPASKHAQRELAFVGGIVVLFSLGIPNLLEVIIRPESTPRFWETEVFIELYEAFITNVAITVGAN